MSRRRDRGRRDDDDPVGWSGLEMPLGVRPPTHGLLLTLSVVATLSTGLAAVPSPSGASNHSTVPSPVKLAGFAGPGFTGEGVWHPAGRLVRGRVAVYTTTVAPPDNPRVRVGVAWMNTSLLHARLYSGSMSPGGLIWKLTAPIAGAATRTLVAAFNGGFLLKASNGGYLSEGHVVAPLRVGAASLVIYRNGAATVGQWGRDVTMTSNVVAVRQNLTLLVDNRRPVAGLNPADTSVWG